MIEDTKALDLDTNKALQKVDLLLNSVRPVKVREVADALLQALKINPELTIKLITNSSICPIFEVPRDVLEVVKEKRTKIEAAIKNTEKALEAYKKEVQQLTETITAIEDSNVEQ